MAVKIVKVTEPLTIGESGASITHRIARMIRQAQKRAAQEGIILPAGRVLLTVEQEYEDGTG